MDNLPKIQSKLNIFQKLRIRLYLMRKYSSSRFNNAPEYLKQDERVLKKMIKGEQSISSSNNEGLIELFKSSPALFDAESKKQVVDYALQTGKYEVFAIFSDEEQYNYIKTKVFLRRNGEVLQFANINVIKRLIDEKVRIEEYPILKPEEINSKGAFGYIIEDRNNKYIPNFLSFCNINVQLEIISQNKDLIQAGSIEAQVEYLKQNEDDIELVNNRAKELFLDKNIEFLNMHLLYVHGASKETQLLFASQDQKNLKYIKPEYQIEIIEKHPGAFEYASESTKKSIFENSKYFSIVKMLINGDEKYYKYLPTSSRHLFVKDVSNRIADMKKEKITDLFVKRDLRTSCSFIIYWFL